MDGKKVILPLCIIASLILALCVTASPNGGVTIGGAATPTYHNVVVIRHYRNGKLIAEYKVHNLITDIGKKYIRNILGFNNITSQNATKWIALSNDTTPSASWTKLPNEITIYNLSRAEGTVTVINGTAYKVSYQFTSTGTITVNVTGLHWSGVSNSDGNLFAAATFTDVNLQSGDKLTIEWQINIS